MPSPETRPVPTPESPLTPQEERLWQAFEAFLHREVADGGASPDTRTSYRGQVAAWLKWCRAQGVDPAAVTPEEVKAYRQALVQEGYQPTSIAHKLTVLRRFYAAAQAAGERTDNPVEGLRPPRNRQARNDLLHLEEEDLARLFQAVPHTAHGKDLRDRTLLGLMGLLGLRTVEISRANVEDLREGGQALLVRGKNRDRLVYLRPDVAELLSAYLAARPAVEKDPAGTPLFVAWGNRAGGKRLSRRGLRSIIDGYLEKADLKRPGRSNHALRHTAGTLAYRHTRDLRAVQELLGHASSQTTDRYTHVAAGAQNNPARAIPVAP